MKTIALTIAPISRENITIYKSDINSNKIILWEQEVPGSNPVTYGRFYKA